MNLQKRLIKWFWVLTASGLAFSFLFFLSVKINLFGLFGKIPEHDILVDPKSELATEIYSSDHKILGKYYSTINRSQITYNDIPVELKNALIATEDVRFYEHSGIDLRGTLSIFYYAITFKKKGASTISQQLAKNLFRIRNSQEYSGPLSGAMPVIKMKEWITAVRLERAYTKDEIILLYLNTVDFGRQAYGLKSAAKKYFNKEAHKLKIEESALLVGLLKNPTFFSPTRNEERAKLRRNTVLMQMVKYGFISREKYDSLKVLPLGLNLIADDESSSEAPYFCAQIKPFLQKWCRENNYNLYEDGLRIYTTVDYRLQTYAEQAVAQHMKFLQREFYKHWKGRVPWADEDGKEKKGYVEKEAKKSSRYKILKEEYGKDEKKIWAEMKKPVKMKIFTWNGVKDTMMSPLDSVKYNLYFLRTGFVSMDPYTGHVKAWVGDIDYRFFKYDHVKQGRRQPGSSFKPIVYAAAMDKFDLTPADTVLDAPKTFRVGSTTWTPKNSNGKYSNEYMTLRQGLAKSINTISAYLIDRVGPENVVDFAKQMGIESPLEPYPTLCLGTSDVTVLELVNAYCVFVNGGVWKKPLLVTKIEDKYGNVLAEFDTDSEEVLNDKTAYYMIELLRGSVDESGGTSKDLKRIYGINADIGGKTGTTQNNSDGWFIGISPYLVSGVWVGGETRDIRFRTMEFGQGAKLALPIWGYYMQQVMRNKNQLGFTKERFDVPPGLMPDTTDSFE
jgi:penicillin-binding protein 1A